MIWISAEDVILIHSRAIQGSSRCAYCRRLFSDFIFSDKLNGCAPSGTAVFAQTRY